MQGLRIRVIVPKFSAGIPVCRSLRILRQHIARTELRPIRRVPTAENIVRFGCFGQVRQNAVLAGDDAVLPYRLPLDGNEAAVGVQGEGVGTVNTIGTCDCGIVQRVVAGADVRDKSRPLRSRAVIGDIGQTAAKIEGRITYTGDTVGNHHACQLGAVEESRIANAGHTVGNRHTG